MADRIFGRSNISPLRRSVHTGLAISLSLSLSLSSLGNKAKSSHFTLEAFCIKWQGYRLEKVVKNCYLPSEIFLYGVKISNLTF